VGNKSNNSFLYRQASKPDAGEELDALSVPRAVITIAFGLAAGVFVAMVSVLLLQHGEKPVQLQGMCLCSQY